MEEEFQESEIMFQEYFEEEEYEGKDIQCHLNSRESKNGKTVKRKKVSSSVPVKIPDGNHWFDQYIESDCFEEEMVPPHLIIRRRIAGRAMAYSLCTGNGRTLKGRDLKMFRNFILRMTGFIET